MFPWEISRVKTLIRYVRIFSILIKIGLMQQMAYRFHFFMMIIGKIIHIGLIFLFFQAVFLRVDRIGRWSYEQVLLLFTTFHIVDYLMSITFHRNLAFQLPRWVRNGELDSRMLLPVNLLFLASFERVDLVDFFSLLPLAQLNRDVEKRGGSKKPQLSDLAQSGCIEADADIVGLLFRPIYYNITEDSDGNKLPDGYAELDIAKHRGGRTGPVEFRFNENLTKIIDIDNVIPDYNPNLFTEPNTNFNNETRF